METGVVCGIAPSVRTTLPTSAVPAPLAQPPGAAGPDGFG